MKKEVFLNIVTTLISISSLFFYMFQVYSTKEFILVCIQMDYVFLFHLQYFYLFELKVDLWSCQSLYLTQIKTSSLNVRIKVGFKLVPLIFFLFMVLLTAGSLVMNQWCHVGHSNLLSITKIKEITDLTLNPLSHL